MNWLLETLAEPSMIQAVAVISIVAAVGVYLGRLKIFGISLDGAEIVVPLVGTWIEILPVTASLNIIESFPSWERGLKSQTKQSQTGIAVSFPSWERGLKYKRSCRKLDRYMSFPSWERGLKSF